MSRPASTGSAMVLLPLFLLFSAIGATRLNHWEPLQAQLGTTWAVLVAGSNGYGNYRHQADICHAYQVLKKGGLKDENIVVFMYDDIATHNWNPRPGTIINHPNGSDVYAGVPKDYTGDDVTAANLYAVLLGDKNAVKGRGSGKVVESKADDRIFLYYSDHGGPGVLGMPNVPYVYANDLILTLEKKHASKGYKEMVIYVESCESGSIFQGLLSPDIDVYVTTASGPTEDSWATYCPGMDPPPPPEYDEYYTCLGDAYSVAWMEDSQSHNRNKETIKEQYQRVKDRTSKFNGSHVMEYGNTSMSDEKLFLYQGFDPASENYPPSPNNVESFGVVNQRDAELVPLWHKYKTSEHGSELLKEFRDTVNRRVHLDRSVKLIGEILYGVLDYVRAPGLPLVDDWGCLKTTVRTFEKHCGSLTQYGMKHMRAFANICNSGVSMEEAAVAACRGYDPGEWHPSNKGYSA